MLKKKITVIPGDGIGPDITESTIKVLDCLKLPLSYEFVDLGVKALKDQGELIPQKSLDSIIQNKIALKGPLETPIGEGFTSINVALRQRFELYANVRPTISFAGTQSRYENIDLIIIRENTEGLYSGKDQIISKDGETAEAKSIVTKKGSRRVVEFAFELAKKQKRKKVTIVHKANILKSTSGLFLKTAREIASGYPDIAMEEMIVDNCCMQLVINPNQFDVICTTNLFGDILSDLCAGLIGGLGMAPGANIGKETAIFEAVHGTAPTLAGKNKANPSSLILAATLMLEHMQYYEQAKKIRIAIQKVILDKKYATTDLGGQGSTTSFTQRLIEELI